MSGIRAQSDFVQKNGLDGVLGTMWHHYYGWTMRNIYVVLSNSVWNSNPLQGIDSDFVSHLRQVSWDMMEKETGK